jgi:CubicO group peptidase (beta-lactamase class C family)
MVAAEAFPQVRAAIQEGIERRLHTGVQIYISQRSQVLLNTGFGEATPGTQMHSGIIMPWRSAGKPVTAVLILKACEAGLLSPEDRLEQCLPEARDTDKAAVRVIDLLTHSGGFPQTETGWPQTDWAASVQSSLQGPRQFEIGSAAYHPQSSWFLLGEIARRCFLTTEFSDTLSAQLLIPLGLSEVWCGVPADIVSREAGRFPSLYERQQGTLVNSVYTDSLWLTTPSPGGNLRGPIRELGRFYEMLLRDGLDQFGRSYLTPDTVRNMTRVHRAVMFDQTLQHVVDFGLGVICNSNRHGIDSVPYGFGRFSGETAFGHGGSQCSMAFCDPWHDLVVAWSANGFCGEGLHQRRNRRINEAVYQDLGLVAAS